MIFIEIIYDKILRYIKTFIDMIFIDIYVAIFKSYLCVSIFCSCILFYIYSRHFICMFLFYVGSRSFSPFYLSLQILLCIFVVYILSLRNIYKYTINWKTAVKNIIWSLEWTWMMWKFWVLCEILEYTESYLLFLCL